MGSELEGFELDDFGKTPMVPKRIPEISRASTEGDGFEVRVLE